MIDDDEEEEEEGMVVEKPTTTVNDEPRRGSPSPSAEGVGGQEISQAYEYQLELFERAKQHNIICTLETGSGKTFIAIMLMKWLKSPERSKGKKATFFLVQTCSLVEQQARCIESNTPFRVGRLTGDTSVHTAQRWAASVSPNDVVVMTAQVLLDALRHRFTSLSDVDLLVFDECHHATKRNPYNLVMREFYDTAPCRSRPRILGLTASPATDAIEFFEQLAELEANLNCHAATSLAPRHVPSASQAVLEFAPVPQPNAEAQALLSTLRKDLAERAYGQLGLWGLRQLAAGEDAEAVAPKADLIAPKALAFLRLLGGWKAKPDFSCITFCCERIVASLLCKLIGALPELSFVKPAVLVGHGGHRSKQDKEKEREPAATPYAVPSMVTARQTRILDRFAKGEFNMLIATSVAEEGLDVRACKLVVRFDRPQHLRSNIQSRGRARCVGSEYVVMVENGDAETPLLLRSMDMYRQHLVQLATQRQIEDEDRGPVRGGDPADSFVVPSTGAKATLDSAVQLLFRYCAILYRDAYCPAMKPTFSRVPESGACAVVLPPNAAVQRAEAWRHGATQQLLRRLAALECVKKLHQCGALDDFLLPAFAHEEVAESDVIEAELAAPDPAVRVPRLRKPMYVPARPLGNPRSLSQPWLDGGEGRVAGFAYALHVTLRREKSACFCIVTPSELTGALSQIAVFTHARPTRIAAAAAAPVVLPRLVDVVHVGMVTMTAEQVGIAQRFTAWMLRKWRGGGDFDWEKATKRYFVLPLASAAPPRPSPPSPSPADSEVHIDWYAARHSVNPEQEPETAGADLLSIIRGLPETSMPMALALYCTYKPDTLYMPTRLREDMSPTSAFPGRRFSTFAEFLSGRWGLAVKPEQPMIQGVHATTRQPTTDETDKRTVFLVPELCRVHPLSGRALQTSHIIAAALWRIEHIELCRELQVECPALRDVTQNELVAAVTAPAVSEDNYDRLETLGDTALKLTASAFLFTSHVTWHEGDLAKERAQLVANSKLCDLAQAPEFALERFLVTERRPKFTAWCAPGAVFYESIVRTVSSKTIADSVEALTGASLMSVPHGIDAQPSWRRATRFLRWIKLPFARDAALRAAIKRVSESTAIPDDSPDVREVLPAEGIIGYHFKHPGLLAEAMTHASYHGARACYQRLEFLGDSVIDALVTHHLFVHFPLAGAGDLHDMRSSIVGNDSLAWLCMARGLNKYFRHFSSRLTWDIGVYASKLNDTNHESASDGPPPFWSAEDDWEGLAPKVLADIVEAVAGAVFIDQCGDMDGTAHVIMPLIDPLVKMAGKVPARPLRLLLELLQSSLGTGWRDALEWTVSQVGGVESWECTALVFGEKAGICRGKTKLAARNKAAAVAYHWLLEHPEALEKKKNPDEEEDYDDDEEPDATEGDMRGDDSSRGSGTQPVDPILPPPAKQQEQEPKQDTTMTEQEKKLEDVPMDAICPSSGSSN